jgi:hypothetical protein
MINFFAATPGTACQLEGTGKNSFFGLPHWWQYLKGEYDQLGTCSPKFKFPDDIWALALAFLNILLFIAGIIAVISIIWAGFDYVTSMGNADKGVAARKRIINSIIGLAIVLIATSVVTFIGSSFTEIK